MTGMRAGLATAAAVLLTIGTAAAQTAAPNTLASRTKGSPRAPVTVYEMSDFQCPYCQRFAVETFPSLEREYVRSGKVRWVFVNFPLTSIHSNAVPAAQVALCAGRQGAFWQVHDLLFTHQNIWAPLKEAAPFFLSLADSARIDKAALLECVKSPASLAEIKAEGEGSERSGAQSTPSFYIEGGLLAGAHPLPVFRQILDSIYALKTKNPAR